MTKKLYEEQSVQNIADAIRAKNGELDTYKIAEMAPAIRGIPAPIIPVGVFGVEWDYSQSSPALTRTNDASLFVDPVPAVSKNVVGSSPFDYLMPWAGMKRYNIINNAISYSEDDVGFSETLYDTVVYIPEFFYKSEKDTSNQKWRWSISSLPREGYKKHPGSGKFVGRFLSSLGSSVFDSKANATIYTAMENSLNYTAMRDFCENKGTDWHMIDIQTYAALQMLYLIEFANFNSQDQLGPGVNTGSRQPTGGTAGAVYHTIKISGTSNQYRWIEDPFSNAYTLVDRIITNGSSAYIDGVDIGFSVPTISQGQNYGWSKNFGFSNIADWAFITNELGGSSSTYITDVYSRSVGQFANMDKVCSLGGSNSKNNYSFGFFYFASNSTPTETMGAYSQATRLLYDVTFQETAESE